MSIEYLKSEHVEFKNGKSINRVEVAVSELSEMSQIKNISDSSLAWHKRTGDFYAYDDGRWYAQDGSGAV